ncbi:MULTISPECIES: NADH:flavin oxidoreductase/NADH oxidase [Paracoccus]|uniref:2,4-dienoyl-CoA reductase-like NADH-dependent reductase (Old Yellow Enzyme family) n=1 Tax=Paracoccus versutus TaxID=34007 RepID=A0A3D9XHW6_PARVE|nr:MULTISPECIES: NADH:flavin oxidoreductase/NADH oxidase [Paracoccus]REF70040.1 2,4-dienoyl-CoA reductase-like NADH-dependent reductase (Old Yellow Enzyme family) [Paracoccus versutus]WGR57625.1 NADH:flavin oxidoreductase/NADH oxidase [Paracoccus versutus]
MPQPKLFEPIAIGGRTLANRIVVAPMCMYSAEDGRMTDWHLIHLGALSHSGAAILTIEATAVLPEGRISYADVGLWDDATEAAMDRVLKGVRAWSDMPIAIQLAHAGRKASTAKPWEGGAQIAPDAPHGWQTVSASDLAFAEGENPPLALDRAGLARVRDAFAQAARRAVRLGIDAIQIHAAHGYLLHQFLSPLSNRREDDYGGSLENRMRFPLEVFEAVRDAVPAGYPVTVRISGTDWVEGGWDIQGSIAFSQALEARGCAAIHVSSGGLDRRQQIPVGPGYQVPLARAVRQAVGIPVIAVGLITEPEQAEAIVATGDADMVALARTVLYDPRWPWHAAARLGASVSAPPQFWRSQPSGLRDLFRK